MLNVQIRPETGKLTRYGLDESAGIMFIDGHSENRSYRIVFNNFCKMSKLIHRIVSHKIVSPVLSRQLYAG